MITSEEKAREIGTEPMGYLRSFAMSGADPTRAWEAATVAARKALEKAGLTLDKMDLIEIHEAFAAQVLANIRKPGLSEKDYDRISVNGS